MSRDKEATLKLGWALGGAGAVIAEPHWRDRILRRIITVTAKTGSVTIVGLPEGLNSGDAN